MRIAYLDGAEKYLMDREPDDKAELRGFRWALEALRSYHEYESERLSESFKKAEEEFMKARDEQAKRIEDLGDDPDIKDLVNAL